MSRKLHAILVAGAVAAAAGPVSAQAPAECRDSFQHVLDGARAEWPQVSPFLLPDEFVRYFMAAYNDEVGPGEQVPADRIMVVPLPPDMSSTWWYFGFHANCLTFYAELSEAKGVHLIEQGHAMLYPEQRLQ